VVSAVITKVTLLWPVTNVALVTKEKLLGNTGAEKILGAQMVNDKDKSKNNRVDWVIL
jgi:hypothetical protein